MCNSKKPKYKPPAVPPEAPRMVDEGAQRARRDDKRKQRLAAGHSSTIRTKDLLGGAQTTTGDLLGA